MVWTDLDQWHWENLRLTTGLRTASFQWSNDVAQRLELRGTFSAEGFVARWTGTAVSLSDAVIAQPGQPCLAVRADGPRLLARPSDVLAPDRFVEGRWLSDEQRRRQAVIENMLHPGTGQVRYFSQPLVLGWGDAVDMGFQLPRHQERVGAALWALPLKIDKPPAGTQVVIPSPFVQLRAANRPTGDGTSPLYDHRTGGWLPSQKPTETWLRFEVPKAASPLRLEGARLTLRITAPSRTLRIVRQVGGRTQVLREAANPIGQIELTLDSGTLPEVTADGRVLLGILVSESADKAANPHGNAWKMDSVQLEISGTVLPDKRE